MPSDVSRLVFERPMPDCLLSRQPPVVDRVRHPAQELLHLVRELRPLAKPAAVDGSGMVDLELGGGCERLGRVELERRPAGQNLEAGNLQQRVRGLSVDAVRPSPGDLDDERRTPSDQTSEVRSSCQLPAARLALRYSGVPHETLLQNGLGCASSICRCCRREGRLLQEEEAEEEADFEGFQEVAKPKSTRTAWSVLERRTFAGF